MALALGFTGPFLLLQLGHALRGGLFLGQLPFFAARPVHRLLQLIDGRLDAVGVLTVAAFGGPELGDLPPGVAGSGVHLGGGPGPGQLGVGCHGGVSIAPVVFYPLEHLLPLLGPLLCFLHHLGEGGRAVLLLPGVRAGLDLTGGGGGLVIAAGADAGYVHGNSLQFKNLFSYTSAKRRKIKGSLKKFGYYDKILREGFCLLTLQQL